MAEYILDEGMIEAIRQAVSLGKQFADKEMACGELTAEQYTCFEVWREKLDRVGEIFGEVEITTGESVH